MTGLDIVLVLIELSQFDLRVKTKLALAPLVANWLPHCLASKGTILFWYALATLNTKRLGEIMLLERVSFDSKSQHQLRTPIAALKRVRG